MGTNNILLAAAWTQRMESKNQELKLSIAVDRGTPVFMPEQVELYTTIADPQQLIQLLEDAIRTIKGGRETVHTPIITN